ATGAPFGDIQVVETRAASTAEIVFALLNALELPITPEVATCLFTGILTDTGSFRFQNVTADTMTVAARLIDAGASPAFVSEHVFENRTFAATKLLGLALSSLSRTLDGRIAWAHVTREDFARLGATDEDSEGLVNPVRSVRGAEVGVSFREMPDGAVRVSLRSREGVDVGQIAQKFGGGGHRMAAGCTLNLPLAEAEAAVLDSLRAALPPLSP
ncbi:MAG: bifunctional oligoribonuclease/PAP phosphatase NrnA, partial [Armatimonadota bacterium]|nr:bifunctional oligoribonuclease/PAP phosphatase NrnA [Armatimonadota bacterium]